MTNVSYGTVSVCFTDSQDESFAESELRLLLREKLSRKPKQWKGKIVFCGDRVTIFDLFTQTTIRSLFSDSSKRIGNVLQLRDGSFLLVEYSGTLHKYNHNTFEIITNDTHSIADRQDRYVLFEYHDFVIAASHSCLVFDKSLQFIKSLPYTASHIIHTTDDNLLISGHSDVILLNSNLELVQSVRFTDNLRLVVEIRPKEFLFYGDDILCWDANTNDTTEMVDSFMTPENNKSVIRVCKVGQDEHKDLKCEIRSRWDGAICEVERGVIAFQDNDYKICVWNIDQDRVEYYQMPEGFLRCFVYE